MIYGGTKEIFADPVYREAARLTGCKNFSDIRRIDAHTAELTGWGVQVYTKKEIPEQEPLDGSPDQLITWFVQRERMPEIEEKGLPDYLEIKEEKIMFLREKNGTYTF